MSDTRAVLHAIRARNHDVEEAAYTIPSGPERAAYRARLRLTCEACGRACLYRHGDKIVQHRTLCTGCESDIRETIDRAIMYRLRVALRQQDAEAQP